MGLRLGHRPAHPRPGGRGPGRAWTRTLEGGGQAGRAGLAAGKRPPLMESPPWPVLERGSGGHLDLMEASLVLRALQEPGVQRRVAGTTPRLAWQTRAHPQQAPRVGAQSRSSCPCDNPPAIRGAQRAVVKPGTEGPVSHPRVTQVAGKVFPQVLQHQPYTGARAREPEQMSSVTSQRLPFFILTHRKNVSFPFCRARSLNDSGELTN